MSTGPDEEHCLMVVSCNSNENGMFLSSQLKFFEKYLRKVNKIFKKVLLKDGFKALAFRTNSFKICSVSHTVHVKKVHFLQFLVSRPDIVEGPFSQDKTWYKVNPLYTKHSVFKNDLRKSKKRYQKKFK